MRKYPFVFQHDETDCGPACLSMVTAYYGNKFSLEELREKTFIGIEGVSLLNIEYAAEQIGFNTMKVRTGIQSLIESHASPCILHWNDVHFVLLYKVLKKRKGIFSSGRPPSWKFLIGDPSLGVVAIDEELFIRSWTGGKEKGVVLFLEPNETFLETGKRSGQRASAFQFLNKYLKPFRAYFLRIFLAMIFGSVISLVFPLLTQSIVDKGVGESNLSLISLILLCQLMLFMGNVGINAMRSWLLLHMNTRVSVSIISDFLMKMMRLPIRFFDTRSVGDLSQRIRDHGRIELFLTDVALESVFSAMNIIVFIVVIGIYSLQVLAIFVALTVVSLLWGLIFFKRRRILDYKRFECYKQSQEKIYELITGMEEIKLNNCEDLKRWNWEKIQVKLFGLNMKGLSLDQYQRAGFLFFNQLKNIIITYMMAVETVHGNLTLGMMLSVSYIIGQSNSPIEQLTMLFRSAQDAKLSLERLREIHNREEEDATVPNVRTYPLKQSVTLSNVSFQYEGPRSPMILKNINLVIPAGKTTAIVGASGSGKTTLLKLLLKFYEPVEGEITVGETPLGNIPVAFWRQQCGVVMQEGYLFADTILGNIVIDQGMINKERLDQALYAANIADYVNGLPSGLQTKITRTGTNISVGQKQRILIARVIYKTPEFIFLDEATSSLDANNEKTIISNLNKCLEGKTVIVIAHRLSTVKNADQIVVLDRGEIVEKGTHDELTGKREYYYKLVKNQLELGK